MNHMIRIDEEVDLAIKHGGSILQELITILEAETVLAQKTTMRKQRAGNKHPDKLKTCVFGLLPEGAKFIFSAKDPHLTARRKLRLTKVTPSYATDQNGSWHPMLATTLVLITPREFVRCLIAV